MQKRRINFAKYRNNGFILDFLIKGLEIYIKEEKLQKVYQRFVLEENISANEYFDTQNTIIEDILYILFENRESEEYRYFEELAKEFLSYFSLYKLHSETLTTSQKQLDFITIVNLIIPFFSHLIFDKSLKYKKDLFLIKSILPDEKKNSIQKLFKLLENSFEGKTSLKKEIYKILDDEYKNYNLIKEDFNNWITGNNFPSQEHINLLLQLAKYSKNISEKELKILFQIAKIIHYLFSKSKEYFGMELTVLLVEHFKMINMISFFELSGNLNIFKETLKKEVSLEIYESFELYLENYYHNNFDLFYMLDYFTKNSDTPNKSKDMLEYIKENEKNFDILYKINEKTFFDKIESILPVKYFNKNIITTNFIGLTINDIDKNFFEFSQLSSKLYEYVEPANKKGEEYEQNFLDCLKKLEEKFDTTEEPYSLFMKARFFAQKKEYKKSTDYYLQALRFGKNSIGIAIKDIIREGLFVSAQDTRKEQLDLINAKSSFTKFYKEAYFYKLIDNLPEEISQHFLLDMQKQFDIYFKNLFPNIKESISGNITSNLFARMTDDLKRIKIDFNNPNKWIKDKYGNKITQLMHCCCLSKIDDVIKLLKNNVNVNEKKINDNGTALIVSLIQLSITQEQIKIAKLLIVKMCEEALNAKLIKRNETALSLAVEKGLFEIVQLLINNGINLKEKISSDQISYLYQIIQLIYFATLPENSFSKLIETNLKKVSLSKEAQNKIIKSNPFINNIFNNDSIFDITQMINNPKETEIWDVSLKHNSSRYKENLNNYYKIFDLLLDNFQNVDIPEINGFTPLIFATEINDNYLVKKLIEKGANIDYYNNFNHRAYDYAEFNKNEELMDLL